MSKVKKVTRFFISFVQKSVNFDFFLDTISYFRFPEVLFPVFNSEAVLEKITLHFHRKSK